METSATEYDQNGEREKNTSKQFHC